MKKKQNIDRSSSFHPVAKSLKGKYNYRTYFRIERDGSIKERIFLHVPDISLREEIICKHYLSFIIRNFIKERTGINFVSRDNPWDFSIELSNGWSSNIEITSVSDNKWMFEKAKREETFDELSTQEKISIRDLKKIYKWFDGKKLDKVIKKVQENSLADDDLVASPFFRKKGRIYISDSKDEDDSLKDLIYEAITRKNKKKHKDKENTILIIDNRASRFEMKDCQDVVTKLEGKISDIPFPEIYFYTGYYSDNDGNNAEYSFLPIKLPERQQEQIMERINTKELRLDEGRGIAYD